MTRAAVTGNVRQFWTPGRVRVFCSAVLALLIFHIAWVFLSDTQHTSLLKRGDFPSFYSAAMILREGFQQDPQLLNRLYDTSMLRYVQNLYWPSLRGGYISFPYPPYVAAALMPLAYFPPLAAKFIMTLFMTACLAGAVAFASAFAPVFRNKLGSAAFFLAFFPVSFSVLGGQNGALSMLCYAGILHSFWNNAGIEKNSTRIAFNEIKAGIWLGLLMFKPQYGAVLFLFFALAGLWRTVLAASGILLLEYLLAAKVSGFLWPAAWISAVSRDAVLDFPYNSFNMVSFSGLFYSLGRWFHAGGGAQAVLNGASIVFSLAVLFLLARRFWRTKKENLFNLLLISAPVLLLISPHALFYDIGLCVIACAAFWNWGQVQEPAPNSNINPSPRDRAFWNLILITFFASLSAAFKNYLPFQPLIFFVLGSFVYICRRTQAAIFKL